MAHPSAGRRGWGPRGAGACTDARPPAVSSALGRVLPWGSSAARGSSAPLPCALEALLPLASHLAREPVLDGTRSLWGQDGHGWACGRFFLQAGEVLRRRRMVAQAQDGGCSKGPLQVGVAARGA
jgi:hypothetical protein